MLVTSAAPSNALNKQWCWVRIIRGAVFADPLMPPNEMTAGPRAAGIGSCLHASDCLRLWWRRAAHYAYGLCRLSSWAQLARFEGRIWTVDDVSAREGSSLCAHGLQYMMLVTRRHGARMCLSPHEAIRDWYQTITFSVWSLPTARSLHAVKLIQSKSNITYFKSAACGRKIGMCGYTAVPEDGRIFV